LYDLLVNLTRALIAESRYKTKNESVPSSVAAIISGIGKSKHSRPSVAPRDMFRDKALYSERNEEGLPTKDASGKLLSRSALKKLKKQMQNHGLRHEKHLRRGESSPQRQISSNIDWSSMIDSYVQVDL